MRKRTICVLFASFFIFQYAFSQNDKQAEKLVNVVLNSIKTNIVRTNFKLDFTDKTGKNEQSVSGSITIKDSKYVIDMMDMKVWFDGKTQWAYILQNNEVSITEPTEKELSEINPIAILSGFKTISTIRFSKIKSIENYCIDLIPKSKSSEVSKIELQVNKNTQNLFLIKLTNKDGKISLLTLNNFQKDVKIADNYFVFEAKKYKGVILNDLR